MAQPLAAAADRHAALGVRLRRHLGLAAAGLAFVHSAESFYALRLLLGIAEGGFAPGVMFYLAQWIPTRYRAGAISTFMLAVPVSAICGGPLAGWLMSVDNPIEWAGWRWMLLIEGCRPPCCCAGGPVASAESAARCALAVRPRSSAGSKTRSRREDRITARESAGRLPLRNSRLWIASACWFGLMAGANGMLYWLPQIIRHLSAAEH